MYIDIVIKFLKLIFFISIISLIIISLYPGSIIGYLLYNDFGQQPKLIKNPFGTSINHFLSYFYVTCIGLYAYSESNHLQKLIYGLFFLSIALEALQYIVPNRAFEIYDLAGNFLGVLVACFLVKTYLTLKHHE